MKVTAIIPSLANEQTKPYLRLCVESLRATTDWDIIVVTNGAKAPEPLGIDGITLRLHTRDQGQCNAVNIGAQMAVVGTEYLFVSNDDMYYAPGWNKNLRFNDLCFSPNLVEPTDNAGSAQPFEKFNGGLTLADFKKNEVNEYILSSVDKEKKGEIGFNFPFFISKDVWDTIGGYDIAYDPWGSNGDTDLQTKIELAGIYPKRYLDVLVYHFGSKSESFTPDKQAFWQNNWDYYTQKWGFNRDQTGGDPWYCKDMIDYDRLKYDPDWRAQYAEN